MKQFISIVLLTLAYLPSLSPTTTTVFLGRGQCSIVNTMCLSECSIKKLWVILQLLDDKFAIDQISPDIKVVAGVLAEKLHREDPKYLTYGLVMMRKSLWQAQTKEIIGQALFQQLKGELPYGSIPYVLDAQDLEQESTTLDFQSSYNKLNNIMCDSSIGLGDQLIKRGLFYKQEDSIDRVALITPTEDYIRLKDLDGSFIAPQAIKEIEENITLHSQQFQKVSTIIKNTTDPIVWIIKPDCYFIWDKKNFYSLEQLFLLACTHLQSSGFTFIDHKKMAQDPTLDPMLIETKTQAGYRDHITRKLYQHRSSFDDRPFLKKQFVQDIDGFRLKNDREGALDPDTKCIVM